MTITNAKTILVRSADFDVSGDGRTLEGLAFRWDHPSYVTDDGRRRYREEFPRASVNRTIKQRAERPLFVAHRYLSGSVGEVAFEPSFEGLVFRARMTDSKFAAATLERVNADELRGVSVGFKPIRNAQRVDALGPITIRAEIAIAELSLAEQGQHDGAEVLAVRAEHGTPRLDALRRRRTLITPM